MSLRKSFAKLNIFLSLSWQVEYTQNPMRGPAEMQYRPQQARQGQFSPIFGPSQPQGPHDYPQTTKASPTGQLSPPAVIVTAPAAFMTGMAEFQTQSFEPRTREKNIIQIKVPNSNKDVVQEILNCQTSWSSRSCASGSTCSVSPDISGQSSRSITPPLKTQKAEANVRAQIAVQVAALLANASTETQLAEKPAEETAKQAATKKVNVHEGDVKLSHLSVKYPVDMQSAFSK